MPIGTVDYVSTAPWNDPFNPWPAYAQVSLSAVDATLNNDGNAKILTLVSFDPYAYLNEAPVWTYESADGVQLILDLFASIVSVFAAPTNYYALTPTQNRGIPAGVVQGNDTWSVAPGYEGADVSTLSIMPVTTYLTPWEFRRRRSLEYV